MPKIGDDSLIVRGERRPDGTWLFTIRYLVHFEPAELGTRFDDSVQIAVDVAASPVPFVACSRCVLRTKRVVVDDDALRAVSVRDDVCATVSVRRRGAPDALTQSARLRRISAQSVGTRPRGPATVSSHAFARPAARST